MYEKLKDRIKTHEGFRNFVYKDSLGKRTVGYGHLCKSDENWNDDEQYSIELLENCFESDFVEALKGAEDLIGSIPLLPKAKEVIVEMVFQLGKGGVSKFKKMWEALAKEDYTEAANQMLDSRWHKQTKSRAESLATIMRSLA
jgi:lysozyme